MSDDPLRDPRFPDRPQHPDYWRLSEIVLQHDGKTSDPEMSEEVFKAIIAEVIDPDSLTYMIRNRVNKLKADNERVGFDQPVVTAGACWLDGFLAGAKFAQRGGHRES